jgi:hypothetical protein
MNILTLKLINKKASLLSVFFLLISFGIAISVTFAPKTYAAPITGFDPGRIIDDGVFTNPATMSTEEIQAFLNSKVPVCDTNGTQASEYGGGTRAQWGAARGTPAPFVCLKDYVENGKTAAEIIKETANTFSINPQILIVVLQKEQALVTDTWPLPGQYKTAAGYGCPDTAACDSQYFGLTNQLQWAARMYRAIMNASPTWYTPYIVGNNTIKYSPDNNCGSSVVNIQNRATQALYNYTPYRPNQATLDAGYGQAPCGAYGNRNFYLYFTDWFGSVRAVNGSIIISHALTTSTTTVSAGDTINAWFEVSNTANSTVNVGGLGICGRLNGAYYDFGFSHQNSLAPNGKLILSYNKKIDSSGSLSLFICSYNEVIGGWSSASYPYNSSPVLNRNLTISVAENPLLTTSVTLSPESPTIGQPTTATMKVRNTSNTAMNIGAMIIAGRAPSGANVDFTLSNDAIVPAGGEYTYSQTRVFNEPGAHTFYIANWNGVWTTAYPKSASPSILRSITTTVKDNPVLKTNVTLSPESPTVGQTTTATVTLQNSSAVPINIGSLVIAGRGPTGTNVDFGLINDVIIPAGGEYVYSRTRTFTQPGAHTFYIANWNGVWTTAYPKSASPSILRSITTTVR